MDERGRGTSRQSEDQIARRLDEIVGKHYHEARSFPERIRLGWRKWLLGVLFAIGAACVVVLVIESHRMPSAAKIEAAKPVIVRILPPPAAPPPDANRR
jgi:hypothetical protein